MKPKSMAERYPNKCPKSRGGENKTSEAHEIRIPKTKRQERPCLRCDEKFLSVGPENRLCPLCLEYAANQADIDELSIKY